MLRAILVALIAATPAMARDTGRIFVSNERSHDVWVFSPDFEHIATIETSRRPRDMKLNADRTLLYVACGGDDVIEVIDVETLEIVDNIPTGPARRCSNSRPTSRLSMSRTKRTRCWKSSRSTAGS